MGGIKHSMWGMPSGEGNWIRAKDPMQGHYDFQTHLISGQAYCKLCGNVIVASDHDMNGFQTDWMKEMEEGMHTKCKSDLYQAIQDEQIAKLGAERQAQGLEPIPDVEPIQLRPGFEPGAAPVYEEAPVTAPGPISEGSDSDGTES